MSSKEQAAAMRAANWKLQKEALQDGRKQRASSVPSGKVYKRKPKYRPSY